MTASFRIATEPFARAVTAASKVVNSHTSIPILRAALFSVADGQVTVRTTDVEMTLERTCPASVAHPGAFTAGARLCAEWLERCDAPEVYVEGEPGRVRLSAGSASVSLLALAPESFPPVSIALSADEELSVPANLLREAVAAVAFCAATDVSRAPLNSLALELSGRSLALVATDGFRLAKWRAGDVLEREFAARTLVVPREWLTAVVRNARDGERAQLALYLAGQKNVACRIGETRIIGRPVDAPFPDYCSVIPTDTSAWAVVATEELKRAIRRARYVDAHVRTLTLSLSPEGLSLRVRALDSRATAHELLEVLEGTGEMEICLEAERLGEIVDHVLSERVELGFVAPLAPATIRGLERAMPSGVLYVLMPSRPVK